MSEELPKILSDEEFAALLKQRERGGVRENDCWDNTSIIPPPKPTDGLPESTLEQKFPRIAQKLTAIWRTAAFAEFVNDLVVNIDRDTRQGFPLDVIEDLLILSEINEMLIGKRGPGFTDPPKSAWQDTRKR